ncbi:MAG: hypothetical protein NW900_02260 [Candidatus Blochmannia sp. A2]|nr:hypothetical protein [Candidatus Blochmannia sp. A2]
MNIIYIYMYVCMYVCDCINNFTYMQTPYIKLISIKPFVRKIKVHK